MDHLYYLYVVFSMLSRLYIYSHLVHFYACDVAGYRDIMPVSELLEHPS